MNHIAAALLLALADKPIDKKGIESVLSAAGSKVNPVVVENILGATKGKKAEEIIKEGLPKLAVAAAVSTGAAATTDSKDAKKDDKKGGKKEEPKKKKQPEPEPEEDEGMMDLFG